MTAGVLSAAACASASRASSCQHGERVNPALPGQEANKGSPIHTKPQRVGLAAGVRSLEESGASSLWKVINTNDSGDTNVLCN